MARSVALEDAYRAARYVVDGPQGFTLRPGRASAPLRARLARVGESTACVISASNPRSVRRSAALNRAANAALRRDLLAAGARVLSGHAEDPSGKWPDEKFCLALGLSRAAALRLARRYGQNAVLWAGPKGRPRLLWA